MRKYQQLRTDIATDIDFRSLGGAAQLLYHLLLTDPSLSYCGVLDWRPRRIAIRVSDWDVDTVKAAAYELEANRYIVIDEDTEETLIRSYLRNAGVLDSKNLGTACARAYHAVSSTIILGVLTDELYRLREEVPNLHGLTSDEWGRAWANPRIPVDRLLEVTDPTHDSSETPPPPAAKTPDRISYDPTPDQWSTPEDPRCRKHANLPRSDVPNCHACKQARHWFEKEKDRHRKAQQRAIAACPICDDRGQYHDPKANAVVVCRHTGTLPSVNLPRGFTPASTPKARAQALDRIRSLKGATV